MATYGKDLKIGQVVCVQGFHFRIESIKQETIYPFSKDRPMERYFICSTWVDGSGDPPPAYCMGKGRAGFGLRVDLPWSVVA